MNDLEDRLVTLLERKADEADVSPDPAFDPARHATGPVSARPRFVAPVLAAAAVVALLVGLVVVATSDRPAVPGDDTPVVDPPATVVDSIGLYPIVDRPVGEGDRRATAETANGDDFFVVTAFVARRTDATITDGVVISALTALPPTGYPTTPQLSPPVEITIDGLAALLYDETDDDGSVHRQVVFPGTPALTIDGDDPVGFLEAAGTGAIRIATVTTPSAGHSTFSIALDHLPNGFSVVVPPTELAPVKPVAATILGLGAPSSVADQSMILVTPVDPIVSAGSAALTAVDIDGQAGWMESGSRGRVFWEAEPGIFVSVTVFDPDADVLALARDVRLVDRATWEKTYPDGGGAGN